MRSGKREHAVVNDNEEGLLTNRRLVLDLCNGHVLPRLPYELLSLRRAGLDLAATVLRVPSHDMRLTTLRTLHMQLGLTSRARPSSEARS